MRLNIPRGKFVLLAFALALAFSSGWLSRVIYDDNEGHVYSWREKWFGVGPFPRVSISGPILRDARTGEYVGVVWGVCKEPKSKKVTGYEIGIGRTSDDFSTKLIKPEGIIMIEY